MSTSVNKKLLVGLSLSATWRQHNNFSNLDDVSYIEDDSHIAEEDTAIYRAKFYIDLAQQAEQAGVDFVFKPDNLWLNLPDDNISLETRGAVRYQSHRPRGMLDPNVIATTIATHTLHIGIVTTISTTFNEPYTVARQLMSMHWMSRGRIGWNVVTSLEGQQNFGLENMPSTEHRYARATEFVEVVQELWDSFMLADQDSAYIKRVDYSGTYFNVVGPLNIPAYPKAKVAIFQAGASAIGRSFASSIADAIFASTPSLAAASELRADLYRLSKSLCRPKPPKLLPGLYFFIRDDEHQSYEAYLQAHAHLTIADRLQKIVDIIGVDLSHKTLSDTINMSDLHHMSQKVRSQTHAQLLRDYISKQSPKLADLLDRPEVISSGHWSVHGTVEQVANRIISWADADAIDGFIALPGDHVSLQRFFGELMPYLAAQGYCRASYDDQSFIERILSEN